MERIYSYKKCEKVLNVLSKSLPIEIYKKYEKTNYSHIMNLESITAIAEDRMIFILNKIKSFIETGEGIDPKGCVKYYKTSVINECSKLYGKYASTKKRGNIKEVMSDNIIDISDIYNFDNSLEDRYFVVDSFRKIKLHLKSIDNKLNHSEILKSNISGAPPNKFFYCDIFSMLLDNYKANDIMKKYSLNTNEYTKIKKSLFKIIKDNFYHLKNDLLSFFEENNPKEHILKNKEDAEDKKIFSVSQKSGKYWDHITFEKKEGKLIELKRIRSKDKDRQGIREKMENG